MGACVCVRSQETLKGKFSLSLFSLVFCAFCLFVFSFWSTCLSSSFIAIKRIPGVVLNPILYLIVAYIYKECVCECKRER